MNFNFNYIYSMIFLLFIIQIKKLYFLNIINFIIKKYGLFDLVTSHNVLAHVYDLKKF